RVSCWRAPGVTVLETVALPLVAPCPGAFPYRARLLGELPNNSCDRTSKAYLPIRATTPKRKPLTQCSLDLCGVAGPHRRHRYSPSSGIAVAVIELKNSYVSIGNGIRTFPEGELAAAYRGSRTNCHRRGCWANAVE